MEDFAEVIKAWRRATGTPVEEDRQSGFRAYRRHFDGGWAWVLEHNGEVIEMTNSFEVLVADHPRAHIRVVEPGPSADSTTGPRRADHRHLKDST